MNVSLIDGHCENEQKENALSKEKLKDVFNMFDTKGKSMGEYKKDEWITE